jgi:hypothetical protein
MNKKIFISYSFDDTDKIEPIIEHLKEVGYDILDPMDVKMGELIFNSIFDYIKTSDFFLIFVSTRYVASEVAKSELNRIIGYAKSVGKPILPILINKTKVPLEISMIKYLDVTDSEIKVASEKIILALERLKGLQLAEEEKSIDRIEKIKISVSDYIEPTIIDLKKRENKLKITGLMWNILGYLSLISGIVASLYLLFQNQQEVNDIDLNNLIYLGIKGAILLTLLLASSKYSFGIAKSYINESLKVADRLHAISFGKFYIKVFEDNFEATDFKEIFQHWNLTKESSFSTLKNDSSDLKSVDSLAELLKSIKGIVKE